MNYQKSSGSGNYFLIEEADKQMQNYDPFDFLSDSEREEFEERAAIIEYDGNILKEVAEKMALSIVLEQRQQMAKAS